jgi:hypothetical protein
MGVEPKNMRRSHLGWINLVKIKGLGFYKHGNIIFKTILTKPDRLKLKTIKPK